MYIAGFVLLLLALPVGKYHLLTLFVYLAGGVFCIIWGIKRRKVEGSVICVVYIIFASCAFIFALGVLARMLLSPGLLTRLILTLQGIDSGVMLGLLIAIRITSNFDRSKSEAKTGQSPAVGNQGTEASTKIPPER
jgi:hypothetical protein